MSMVLPQYCKQVTLQNVTYQNTHGVTYQLFSSDSSQSLVLRDIKLKNITGSESPVAPIIHLKDLATTKVEISGFSVENSVILNSNLLKNTVEFDSIILEDVFFSNVTVGSKQSLIVFENLNYFKFDNHSFIGVRNSDSVNTDNSIVLVSSLNMEASHSTYSISNINSSASPIQLFKLTSLSNIPSVEKLFQMTAIFFTN